MNDQRQTALIMTVGLPGDQGGDIVEALSLDLKELQPTRLVLIASSQSRPNAERILERSSLPRESAQVIELVSAHDLDEIFQKMNAVVQRLIAEGFSADSIAINYTSGTKIMGSGAVLSAVYNRIKELRYITGLGAPRESGRRHRILTTHPAAVFSYPNVLSSLSMMRELRFLSARRVLESVDHSTLPPDDVELYLQLSTLARGLTMSGRISTRIASWSTTAKCGSRRSCCASSG